MPLAASLDFPTQAGCIARVYDSKEEMIASLKEMEFDEMVVFNTNSVQNAYIYNESVKLGKSFSGYELITNSCGIAASNNNCWREKI